MSNKFKHMTSDDRLTISTMLDKSESLTAIAKALGKDISTISKEIRRNSVKSNYVHPYATYNDCQLGFKCGHRTNCNKCYDRKRCKRCS